MNTFDLLKIRTLICMAVALGIGSHAIADNQCGPKALFMNVNMLGKNIGYPEVLSHVPVTPEGCTIFDLVVASKSLGLEADAVQMKYETLQAFDQPVILYLEEKHFILVDPRISMAVADEQYFRMFDDARPPSWIGKGELLRRWGGKSIILQRGRKLPAEEAPKGPSLDLDTYFIDMGDIPTNQVIELSIPFRNIGTEPLEIVDIQKSCGCTTAESRERIIQSRDKSAVDIVFDTHGKKGHQSITATLLTNDVLNPEKIVTIYAFVTTDLVVTPGRLRLGQPSPDHPGKGVITVDGGHSLPFQVSSWKFVAEDPQGTLRELNKSAQLARIDSIQDAASFEFSFAPELPEKLNEQYTYSLKLKGNHAEACEITIPVVFSDQSEADLARNQAINFGLVKRGTPYTASIHLESAPAEPVFDVLLAETTVKGPDRYALPEASFNAETNILQLKIVPRDIQGEFADLVKGVVSYRSMDEGNVSISWKYLNVM